MKQKKLFLPTFLLLSVMLFSSCKVIGDIFSAGVWFGVIGVVAVVAIIIWVVSKAAGGGK